MKIVKWILIFLIFPGLIACQSSENKGGSGKTQGQTKSKNDQIEQLNKQILESPNDPNLYIKRAMAYRDKSMMQLAIRDAQRALAIDSTVSFFHGVLGELEFQSGNLGGARIDLQKAVDKDPTNTDALLKLGETDFLLRRYDEAIKHVNDALRQNDQLAQGYFIKGYIYKELGDTALSKSSFQTATEVNPDHYESFMELGNLSAYQGDPLALEYFNTALTIRPNSAEALYNKGMFLQAGSKFDEAMNVYRKLMELDPDNFLGYYNAGYLDLTEFQKYDSALFYFDQVLTLQPDYIDAVFNRGVCYEEMGEKEKAIETYRKVLDQNPQYTLAAKGLERLLE